MVSTLPCLLAAAALAVAAPGCADDYLSYTGTAVALRSREFLYGESHVLATRAGKPVQRVVLYTCRDGTAFARKTVSYEESFAPNFVLEDASNGMREGLRPEARGRTVFFRPAAPETERSAPLTSPPGLIADAGFDEFVRANWEPLTAERGMTIRFLVPSRLGDVRFRIEELRADRAEGVPVQAFRLNLAGVAGWFLPGIDVYYGAEDHELRRYVGLSDLRGPSGDNLTVDIAFDPKDRRPTGRDALERALQARLAACP